MPYILPEERSKMDDVVLAMYNKGCLPDGHLNYVLFKYCKKFVRPSYNNYKNFCGELERCIHEIERKILDPYEDKKIEENGDVD